MNSSLMLPIIRSIKKYWVYAFFVFALVLSGFTFLHGKRERGNVGFTTFHTAAGWGYDVHRNGRLFIHQEYMPAVDGRQGFPTKRQAEQAAQLVLSKMRSSTLPMVTREEIEAIVR